MIVSRRLCSLALLLAVHSTTALALPRCLSYLLSPLQWLSSNSHTHALTLTEEEDRQLRSWLDANRFSAGYAASQLTEVQIWLSLAELPEGLRGRLLGPVDPEREPLRWREAVENRFQQLGYSTSQYAVLNGVLARLSGNADAVRMLDDQLSAVSSLPVAERESAKADLNLRIRIIKAKARLDDHRNPEYRLKWDGPYVVFPDGVKYRYQRLWNGSLRIWIRYENILRSQNFESTERITYYRTHAFAEEKTGFSEPLGADGRALLGDAHHRTKAYALKHATAGQDYTRTKVPFLLAPAEDGHYYSVPHWFVLSSGNFVALPHGLRRWSRDLTWSFLSSEEREGLLLGAESSPLATIQQRYYRETGLSRIPDEP